MTASDGFGGTATRIVTVTVDPVNDAPSIGGELSGNREPFRPNYPEMVDELFAGGEAPPTLVAFVDCWTSLGGSQFLNSPGTGRYLDYLCDEVVAFVDGAYPTLPAREHRGIAGKSSGGYGAMVAPMLRPDVFGALAELVADGL
mgnify:CR=1 FL=1